MGYLVFFVILLSNLFHFQTSTAQDYLKLPLLRQSTPPSAADSLVLDTHRLSHLHRPKPRTIIKTPVVSGASSGSGQYFVVLRLGSPPQTVQLVADTGSDLLWVACSACRANCTAHLPGSAFLARRSSSFSPYHCFDSQCRLVPPPSEPNHCSHTRLHSPCRYEYQYADGSKTSGFFSKESTTVNTSSGKERTLGNISFGCGFRISGPSVSGASFNGAHGVMGLGRGSISFASQLGLRFGNKFSYCLLDYTISPPPTSYLTIGGGKNAIFTSKMSFTPLLENPQSPTFYYIGIKHVFINGVKLRIDPSVWSLDEFGNGGTVVDSGTTLSFVAEPAYKHILTAVERRVRLPSPTEPTPGFDLCVNVSGATRLSLPRLSLELEGGAKFTPPPRNYFIDTKEGVKCLAIQPVNTVTGFSVIGNLMQQGFLFEFDRDKSRLGFTRRGCGSP